MHGTAYKVKNDEYAVSFAEDTQLRYENQVISDVMMGNYCLTNPELFINADFTQVKL